MNSDVTYLGRVDFRNDTRIFGIKREDRFAHLYAIGKTGTGKSTLLAGMALQDLANGNGFALIDPLGDLAEHVASRVPASRQNDLIYLNVGDVNQPWGYNPLRQVAPQYVALAASGFMEVFKKMWPDAWGVRMEHILRNVLMALLERPASTMHDILRVLSDKDYRKQIARSIRNEPVRRFFEQEYEKFSSSYRADASAPIDFQFGGKRYRKRSPENTRQGALAYEWLQRQYLARGEPERDEKPPRKDDPTFAEFAETWLNDYVRPNNKYSEQIAKKYVLSSSLIPFFGKKPVGAIRGHDIEQYKAKQVQEGFKNKTIMNRLTVLNKCLATAYEWLELEGAPPKIKWPKWTLPQIDYLSPDECDLLVSHTSGVVHEMVLMALRTGMRQGELRGLQWSSIDWLTRTVTVRHSRDDFRRILVPPKNNRMRHIPMDVDLYAILYSRKQDTGYVFRARDGQPFNNDRLNDAIRKLCKQAGLRMIGWHTLRHTFASPALARMLTAPKREMRIRQVMDEGKVLIANLAKGRIGEDSSSLLGGLLVTTLGLAAYTRVDTPAAKRRDFFIYIDEFQSFTTLALANMLSELRKYRVGFAIAHQFLHQLTPEIRHAVLGNVGTFISFRVGPEDASYVVREFQSVFEQEDVINLENYRIYLKLLIDGMPSWPFSARTLPGFSLVQLANS